MSKALQDFKTNARIAHTLLEEALLCASEGEKFITIGGKNGPVMLRDEAIRMKHLLENQQKMQSMSEIRTSLKQHEVHTIICDSDSFWFKFQSSIEAILKE